LSIQTPRSSVLAYNTQCVTVYFVTSLHTVIYIELWFTRRKWNIFDKRKRKKINISYLHNEPGLSLYEASECQQFVKSTFAGPALYFIFFSFGKNFSEALQLCFPSKDDKLSKETPFSSKKWKRFCNSSNKIGENYFNNRCET
jgi:hypothetical protein